MVGTGLLSRAYFPSFTVLPRRAIRSFDECSCNEEEDRLPGSYQSLVPSIPYRESSNYDERFSESPSHPSTGTLPLSRPRFPRLFETSGSPVSAGEIRSKTEIGIARCALYVTHPLYARFSCIMRVLRGRDAVRTGASCPAVYYLASVTED